MPPPFKVAVVKEYVDYAMIHSAKEHWGSVASDLGQEGHDPCHSEYNPLEQAVLHSKSFKEPCCALCH